MKIELFCIAFIAFVLGMPQAHLYADEPWKLDLTNAEHKIHLKIDLHEESIEVPYFEMFGPMHGYMDGDIYGIWYVTSCNTNKETAEIKVANDLGSETQKMTLTQLSDSTWGLKLANPVVIKKVSNKKLVKLADTYFVMQRKK